MSEARLAVLAARISADLGPAQVAIAGRNAAEAAQAERRRGARDRLLAELAALGRAAGWIQVEERPGVVVFRLGRRALRFERWGPSGVLRVRGTGLMTSCFRLVPADAGWALEVTDRDLRRHSFPLFDEGMVLLLQRALRIPLRPVDRAPAPPALQG